MKGKRERERYTQLNVKFQRLERRDKKAFLNEKFKGIEESNRMGGARYLFKKIKHTKKHFMQEWHNEDRKKQGPNRSRRD